jgi:hypothetical protein
MAGYGAQLLVGARGTDCERRACCKRLLTSSGTARDVTFTGVCDGMRFASPLPRRIFTTQGARIKHYVDAARGQVDVEIAARRLTREGLDTPPTNDVSGVRRLATCSRACASVTSPMRECDEPVRAE